MLVRMGAESCGSDVCGRSSLRGYEVAESIARVLGGRAGFLFAERIPVVELGMIGEELEFVVV